MSLRNLHQNLDLLGTLGELSYMDFVYNETCGISWKVTYSKIMENLATQTWSKEDESVLEGNVDSVYHKDSPLVQSF